MNAAYYAPGVSLRAREWVRFRLLRLWEERPSLRSVAVVVFVLTFAGISAGFGFDALRRFLSKPGMVPVTRCFFGGTATGGAGR